MVYLAASIGNISYPMFELICPDCKKVMIRIDNQHWFCPLCEK